ncbi:hypothetical protein [Methylobacter sp.]|uniref:hypothetical protein n=1 Tax=Methylobacter sp. TaxID=2051955 RepID=UPI003DA4885F
MTHACVRLSVDFDYAVALFSACVESLADEHASKVISMQVAEKNTRQRQSPITEEFLDVVSGFEALGSKGSIQSGEFNCDVVSAQNAVPGLVTFEPAMASNSQGVLGAVKASWRMPGKCLGLAIIA